MADFRITFARSARKELQALDAANVGRIFVKIEALASRPRPAKCLKLRGKNNLWRIRVGVYRVVYTIDDRQKLIDIITVRHRKDVYR
jgi:mRNA interferase RelE/StbE